MVVKNRQVLLGLRSTNPETADSDLKGEGTWTMPGGKIRFGESFEQAAARELTEETGLVGKSFQVICVSNDQIPNVHFITIGLYCDDFTGEVMIMEPDEITEWRWFDFDKLPQNLFMPSRKMLDNYTKGQFYQTGQE